ncbi:uncharacterized protein LOC18017442 isoform X2 [Eutrema salsugineum]|uniref:uncharacterized protein LOC18017442 isoform X2 n=1 Tax=Eutrema salsugineum TaxID=72664 RepID=UPI000CED2AB7|nr:uncharacterized protein LOC18017442 isoform X2 [Eutrema salsugineum]
MAATVLLRLFTPIPSSIKPPSRHRRFLHHNLFPNIPLPSSSSLVKFGAGNSEPQPPPPLPEADCPVPPEQQPINEYQSLSSSFPFSWASGDLVEYSSRLFVTGASFAFFVGLPVSWFGSVGPEYEPVKRILAAGSSGIFVVTLAVVRMYLGWAYVGNRLLSATVEYEETGWYDGMGENTSSLGARPSSWIFLGKTSPCQAEKHASHSRIIAHSSRKPWQFSNCIVLQNI